MILTCEEVFPEELTSSAWTRIRRMIINSSDKKYLTLPAGEPIEDISHFRRYCITHDEVTLLLVLCNKELVGVCPLLTKENTVQAGAIIADCLIEEERELITDAVYSYLAGLDKMVTVNLPNRSSCNAIVMNYKLQVM